MGDVFNFGELIPNAQQIASSTMKSVIGDSKYAHGKVQEWIDKIGALSVEELQGLSPNFKYVVTTLIIQKLGSGLRMETVAHWDAKTDGSVIARYENDSMICICTIVGLSI